MLINKNKVTFKEWQKLNNCQELRRTPQSKEGCKTAIPQSKRQGEELSTKEEEKRVFKIAINCNKGKEDLGAVVCIKDKN